jgi:glycosyltransferase involved in cell wall biosynthesis
MKICLISQNHVNEAIGGAEFQCYYIAEELNRRGIEVFYIFFSTKMKKRYVHDNITYHPIYTPVLLRRLLSRFLRLRITFEYYTLRKEMGKIHAQYWYYRTVNTFLPSLTTIKNKTAGGKLIFALSMDMQARKEGWLARFGKFYEKRFRESLKNVDYLFFQKESQRTEFLKNYDIDGFVIYNGHPPPNKSLNLQTSNKPSDNFKIIWVGNLKKMKRPELFIELTNKLTDLDIFFDMVGKPSELYEKTIAETSRKINNFCYHGQLKNDAVLKMIQTSTITVSTSSLTVREDSSEGFPNVFIESWKYGVPVISFFDPDGLITRHKLGFVCRDIDEMVQSIRYLYDNPEIYRNMSTNCIKIFNEKFSIERNVDLMIDILQSQ